MWLVQIFVVEEKNVWWNLMIYFEGNETLWTANLKFTKKQELQKQYKTIIFKRVLILILTFSYCFQFFKKCFLYQTSISISRPVNSSRLNLSSFLAANSLDCFLSYDIIF